MRIKPLHWNFEAPVRSSTLAGGYDVFMPENGNLVSLKKPDELTPLGFAAEVPEGYVALLLPRSGAGHKGGLHLNNTIGVIDADYRGQWMASLGCYYPGNFTWKAKERLLQFILVPVSNPELVILADGEELDDTDRGDGGFGSTGSNKPEPESTLDDSSVGGGVGGGNGNGNGNNNKKLLP